MQTKDRNGLKDNPVGEGYGFNFKKSSDEGLHLSWMCLTSQKRLKESLQGQQCLYVNK